MKNKWYTSSTGSGDMALTVKGLIVAALPILLAILSSQGYTVDQGSALDFIDSAFVVISSIMVMAGLGRKLYYASKE